MQHWLADSLDAFAGADGERLWSTIQCRLELLGFDRVMHVFRRRRGGRTRLRSTMPGWWVERYDAEQRGRVDPFFEYCCRSFTPMATGPEHLRDYPFLDDDDAALIGEAGDAGFRAGLAIPVGLQEATWVGGWNIGGPLERRESELLLRERHTELQLALLYAHERLEDGSTHGSIRLTPREYDCLTGLARGEQTKQIAARLRISDRTVEFHVRNARQKLGAATREQAVARAVHWDLVEP